MIAGLFQQAGKNLSAQECVQAGSILPVIEKGAESTAQK